MRAMLLERPLPAEQHPLALRELADPVPGPRQLRVAVQCCGLCHTDLHTVEGELALPVLPIIPGHQIVATVESCGSDVRSFREGDRVGVPWLYWTCGECVYCRSGQENLCVRGKFTGLHANGGYATRTVIEEAFCCRLPDGFSDVHAAPLLCAGIVGYRAFRLSGVSRGQTLGLYGFGASAHIVLQFARHLGCNIFVFTRTEAHRELARNLGAAWAGDAKDQPPEMLDSAIIFAPAGALVLEALRAIRKGGTCTLAGITMSDIPQMRYDLIYGERVLRSVANATRRDAHEFLELAAQVPIRTSVQEFPLDAANEALVALKHSRIGGAGVLRISP